MNERWSISLTGDAVIPRRGNRDAESFETQRTGAFESLRTFEAPPRHQRPERRLIWRKTRSALKFAESPGKKKRKKRNGGPYCESPSHVESGSAEILFISAFSHKKGCSRPGKREKHHMIFIMRRVWQCSFYFSVSVGTWKACVSPPPSEASASPSPSLSPQSD